MPSQDNTEQTSFSFRVRVADNAKVKEEKFIVVDSQKLPKSIDELFKLGKAKLNLKKKVLALYNGKSGQVIESDSIIQKLFNDFTTAKRKQLQEEQLIGSTGLGSKPSDDLFFVFSTNLKQTFQGKITQPVESSDNNTTTSSSSVEKTPEVVVLIKDSWLDDGAIKQLQDTARTLKCVRRATGQPDLHPGKTFPVGAAISTVDYIYPPLVGNDIGCGMSLYQTNLTSDRGLKQLEKWVKQLNGLERGGISGDESRPVLDVERKFFGLDSSEDLLSATSTNSENVDFELHEATTEFIEKYLTYFDVDLGQLQEVTPNLESEEGVTSPPKSENKALEFAIRQLGTVGGGNHFAELQIVEKICNEKIFEEELKLSKDACFLMVHSGSRSLGDHILGEHEDKFGNSGLLFDSDDAKHYMKCHDNACRWAKANRALIARKFLTCINGNGKMILDICHNNVVEKQVENERVFIHRKGAAPTDAGYFCIPGSRGSFSYLVRGREEDIESQIRCNFSAAHGAGRKWKRSKSVGMAAKENVQSFTVTDLGSHVICEDKNLLFEEQPAAYKDIDAVISDLVHFGVVEVVAIMRPLITYKMRNCCH
ncbi:predicted protein [Naegleria gruberi]|uniref:3'-phosphate/5'-hydroxy nucleic acid ligase n=1 Tax=Naegleria gruberi TaxID=5762 RepID=D2VBK9_NAEGR|nr:uncharacterized protein NAEGRDRAFT_66252 [Naegleria gruberi]EFC45815.1 predicted protein [Naegleria gruberi]|eukprot:XP_002678559.1 predicted protein [Naegleria gruberi strain NEG-M]